MAQEQDDEGDSEGHTIKEDLTDGLSVSDSLSATVWKSQTFAPDWLEDAETEASKAADLLERAEEAEDGAELYQASTRALHREIVFSVCFAEAFLLEYLRDYVFASGPKNRDFDALNSFLRREELDWDRTGIKDRWRNTVRLLQDEGLLEEGKMLGGQTYQVFKTEVVEYRDVLLHSRISQPIQAQVGAPEPTPRTLREHGPGWSSGVVKTLARQLHELNPRDRDMPDFLREP